MDLRNVAWVVISLPDRQDRRGMLAPKLEAAGVIAEYHFAQRPASRRPDLAAQACMQAHAAVVQRMTQDARDLILLEDDADPSEAFMVKLGGALIPADAAFIILGCSGLPRNPGTLLKNPDGWAGTHSVLYPRASRQNFLEHLQAIKTCHSVEQSFTQAARTARLPFYVTGENIFNTVPSLSDRTGAVTPGRFRV